MRVSYETNLKDFDFWGNAEDVKDLLTDDEFDTLEDIIFDDDTIDYDRTMINDMFAYEFDDVISMLGYEDIDDFLESRK